MNKKELLQELIVLNNKGSKWLDAVPSEISAAFYDNPYMENIGLAYDTMIRFIFPKEELDWVYWALYEWKQGFIFTIDDVEYKPESQEEMIEMLFARKLISE